MVGAQRRPGCGVDRLAAGRNFWLATTRVYNVLDSYAYGFALQEATLPFTSPEEMASQSEQMLAAMADAYPHLATVQRELVGSGFDYADEFEAGLDIILGALPEPSSR